MSLGAFVITFNRPQILSQTLQTVLAQTHPPDYILVVDNGNAERTDNEVPELRLPILHHHAMGDNLGPAAAEAYGLTSVHQRGFEWIYWIDDDNPPQTPDTLARLMRMATGPGTSPDVAAVGAVGQRFDWRRGVVERLSDHELAGPVEVDLYGGNCQVIIKATTALSVGVPDARFFIDFEDTEYFLRLRAANMRLLADGDLMHNYRALTNRLGYHKPRRPNFNATQSSVWRRYYSTRNFIFSMREVFNRPDLARREVARAMARATLSWSKGLPYGYAYSKMQALGVIDAYRGRLGRTVLPQPKHPASV